MKWREIVKAYGRGKVDIFGIDNTGSKITFKVMNNNFRELLVTIEWEWNIFQLYFLDIKYSIS